MIRFDELPAPSLQSGPMAVSNRDVLAVQRCYPQIYLACHTRHQRRRSNSAELTGHESALLAHLREDVPITPSALAAHLGTGRPAMSAAIKRLLACGYLRQTRGASDARVRGLWLTPEGTRALQLSSVLETKRVVMLLAALSAEERAAALAGLELLAHAAGTLPKRDWGTT
jgi:DNA-binding MarR family transcriptional regulator